MKGADRRQQRASPKLSRLYEADETAWLEETSRLIREQRYGQLDYKNLSEFLLDMARSERREVSNRLRTLLTHLLKWDYQTRKRSRSWEGSIISQRYDLQELLESRTLKNHAHEVLAAAYRKAVKQAARETGLVENRFPAQCPYSLDQLLSTE